MLNPGTERERGGERQRQRETETERERQTDRQTETETDRERHTDRDRDKQELCEKGGGPELSFTVLDKPYTKFLWTLSITEEAQDRQTDGRTDR